MKDEKAKTRLVVGILVTVVVLLILFVLYLVVFQPQYSKFVDEKRVEGINLFIGQILANGFAQIPVGNQSLILAPVTPQELQFLQQIRQQQISENKTTG